MTGFSSELLRLLREHTREQHRAIECQPLMRDLLTTGVTEQAYGAVLQAFFQYYTALERKLLPTLAELPVVVSYTEYQYVPRSPLLRQDLIDLKISPKWAAEWKTSPVTAVDSFGATLGVLYVLEGSTQGGRVIAPVLARSLGVDASRGGHFFSLHADTNNGWLEFEQLLNAVDANSFIADSLTIELAVDAARSTFEGLHNHLDARAYEKDLQL